MCVFYLEVAEVDHAIHHLTNAEAVAEVVERVVTVVLLNCQLGQREMIHSVAEGESLESKLFLSSITRWGFGVYQPALQRNGVHVELLHKSQVVVHVFQTT